MCENSSGGHCCVLWWLVSHRSALRRALFRQHLLSAVILSSCVFSAILVATMARICNENIKGGMYQRR